MKELTPFRQWLREQELKQEKIDNSFSDVLSAFKLRRLPSFRWEMN